MGSFVANLKETLSDKGRESFRWVVVLSVVVGLIRGGALIAFIPASSALVSGRAVWGLTTGGWVGVVGASAAAAFVIEYALSLKNYSVAFDFLRFLHIAIGRKVAAMPLGAFTPDTAGKTSRLVSRELMLLGEIFAHMFSPALIDVVTSLTMLVGICVWNPPLGLACLLAIPFMWAAVWASRRAVAHEARLTEPAANELAGRLVEYAQKQGALRACGRGDSFDALTAAEDAYQRRATKGLWWATAGQVVNGMAAQAVVVSVVYAIGVVAAGGSLSPLEAVVAIGVLLRFMQILVNIGALVSSFETRRPVLELAHEVLSTPELPEPAESAPVTVPGEVVVDSVDFGYEAGAGVLHDVSFRAAPGTMTAIVGPSGCGKTTIARLVCRFYDVDSGAVRVGGNDVRDYSTEDLMEQLSMVFQDVYLFDDTLIANIRVGREDATDEQVMAAARMAGAEEIADRLPLGWSTPVGEGGRALSGGERQRVSVARALLKGSPIVLFDEATSALDPENESHIVEAMEELRRSSTLIVIAHKLDTIASADQIVVLDENGRVVQIGAHQELYDAGGPYRRFWRARERAKGWRLI